MCDNHNVKRNDFMHLRTKKLLLSLIAIGMLTGCGNNGNNHVQVTATQQPNTKPVAQSQTVQMDEDTSKIITLKAKDEDNDKLTYKIITKPKHGLLSGKAPQVTYTPNKDYFGSDSFTFIANDGKENSVPATVSMMISDVIETPIAKAQSISVKKDTSKQIVLRGLGATMYIIETQPVHGTLTGVAPNLTYMPDKDYIGRDSFTFKVGNSKTLSSATTVTLSVTAYQKIAEYYDKDNDGKIEENTTRVFNFDGKLISVLLKIDSDGDGIPNEIMTDKYIFDAEGNMTNIYTLDKDGDGKEDKNFYRTYDKDGHEISRYRKRSDGTLAYEYRSRYDADGNMIYFKYDDVTVYKSGVPKHAVLTVIKTYDEHKNILSDYGTYDWTDGTKTENNELYSYTYNVDGNMMSKSVDFGADGTIDSTEERTYDANGKMLTRVTRYSNGAINERESATYTYNSSGKLISRISPNKKIISTYKYAKNGTDEIFHSYKYYENLTTWTFTYDNIGRRKSYTYKKEKNGKEISNNYRKYMYDGQGKQWITDSSYSHYTYELDENRNVISLQWDKDHDGVPDGIVTFTYDDHRNVVLKQYDEDADGVIDSSRTYIWG